MKNIAFLGWADLRKGAREGGGYNLVCQQHSLELAKRGWRVSYLQSGVQYSPGWLFGKKPAPKIKYKRKWQDISLFSLENSHNRAHAIFNFQNYRYQTDDPEQNRLVLKWLENQSIDSVFIHSLEGHSITLPLFLKSNGISVKIFCHDHFFICPQVKLLYKRHVVCTDNNKGLKCSECAEVFSYPGFEKSQAAKKGMFRIIKNIRSLFLRKRKTSPPKIRVSAATNEDLLKNLSQKNTGNYFGIRKKTAINMLNAIDKLYVPSSFLANTLKASGVKDKQISECKISLPHLETLARLMDNQQRDENKSKSNLTYFCYHGSDVSFKGMAFLFKAIAELDGEIKTKCRFIIYGVKKTTFIPESVKTDESIILKPPFSVNELYEHTYDAGFLPHLWYENSPITLLEHLAMGKPVLCSKLGGVVDFINDNQNGWFFEAGNTASFTGKIRDIIKLKKENLFPSPESVRKTFSFREFIESLIE